MVILPHPTANTPLAVALRINGALVQLALQQLGLESKAFQVIPSRDSLAHLVVERILGQKQRVGSHMIINVLEDRFLENVKVEHVAM